MGLKVMVVYSSAGSGHRTCAQAIHNCLKRNYPEVNATLVDVLEYTNSCFANSYSRGYAFLVTYLRFIWAISYHLTRIKLFSWWLKSISRLNCRRFIKLLENSQPDIVVATHFFPAEVVACLKQKGRINSRLVVVMTDFSVHPLWVIQNYDDYIAGSQHTASRLVSQGIKQDKIRVWGVPVKSGFLDKAGQMKKADVFTALLVTGTFGFSLLEKIVDMLYPEINLLVVCGNNQRLYNRLKSKQYAGVRLYGFTDQIPLLMSQADVVITKPGGLTIAETLIMQLPMIFVDGIPGQEIENAQILESAGCAMNIKNIESLRNIIVDLKTNRKRLDLMRANIDKFRKPQATEDICQYIAKDVCSGSI